MATTPAAIVATSCLDGMHEDYKLMSRKRLQEWFLPHIYKKAELAELSKAVIYTDLLAGLFPSTAPLLKGRKENSRGDFDNRHNFLILMKMLAKVSVKKEMDVDKLAKTNLMANWEFTRWFIYFHDVNAGLVAHVPPTPGFSTPRNARRYTFFSLLVKFHCFRMSILPSFSRASLASSRVTLTNNRRFSIASTISVPATPVRRTPQAATKETAPSPPNVVDPVVKKATATQTAREIATQTEPMREAEEEEQQPADDVSHLRRMPRDSIELPYQDGAPKKFKYQSRK